MKYELMIIGNVDGDFAGTLSKVEKTIKENKGEKVTVNKLGIKALSYQISKQSQGEYVVINFEGEATSVKGAIDLLRLERDNILRYLLTKLAKGFSVGEKEIEKPKAKAKVTVKTVVAKASKLKVEKPKVKRSVTKKVTKKKK